MNLLNPIFIIGSPRSGTTLLRLIINNHPDVIIPPECGFIQWWHSKYKDIKEYSLESTNNFVEDILSSKKIETWKIDARELKGFLHANKPKNYALLSALVYQHYSLQSKRNCNRWGDKNNYYIQHLKLLSQIYPDATYVYIVRDLRDIICSYKALKKIQSSSLYFPVIPKNIELIIAQWIDNNNKALLFFNKINKNKVIFIRYEDLVNQPLLEIKNISDRLGIQFSKNMLNYHITNKHKAIEPIEFLSWKEKTLLPLDNKSVGKYKSQLSRLEKVKATSKGFKLLSKFKYEL